MFCSLFGVLFFGGGWVRGWMDGVSIEPNAPTYTLVRTARARNANISPALFDWGGGQAMCTLRCALPSTWTLGNGPARSNSLNNHMFRSPRPAGAGRSPNENHTELKGTTDKDRNSEAMGRPRKFLPQLRAQEWSRTGPI